MADLQTLPDRLLELKAAAVAAARHEKRVRQLRKLVISKACRGQVKLCE